MAININLGKGGYLRNHILTNDKYGFIIKKKMKTGDEVSWVGVKWFGTLEAAMNGIVNMMVKELESETFEELLSEVKEIRKWVKENVKA